VGAEEKTVRLRLYVTMYETLWLDCFWIYPLLYHAPLSRSWRAGLVWGRILGLSMQLHGCSGCIHRLLCVEIGVDLGDSG
jgi:hypothetical protein